MRRLEHRNLLRCLLLDRLPEDRGYEDTAKSALARFHLQAAPTSHPELRLTVYAPADDSSRAALADFVAQVGARG